MAVGYGSFDAVPNAHGCLVERQSMTVVNGSRFSGFNGSGGKGVPIVSKAISGRSGFLNRSCVDFLSNVES